MFELLILLLTGIATGFVNVMAGGGSMLSIPVMIFLGVSGQVANGTNRIAILPQNVFAVIAFYRKGYANFKLGLSLSLATIPGALIGSYAASIISADRLNTLLAIIMLAVLLIMIWPEKPSNTGQQQTPKNLLLGHLLMSVIGFWGGFIHIGVGFLLMPVLNRVMGLDLITTNSHKVFIVLCYTVVALVMFASHLELIWKYGIALAIGTSIGGWIAANVQIKKGVGVIRIVLNTVIVAFIIKLLFF